MITENDIVIGSKTYFLSLPKECVHCHTLMGMSRRLNCQVKEKIEELVSENITNVKVIKKILRGHVKELCKHDTIQPHSFDRSYYPSERDIINCIHVIMSAGKYSQLDQVNLEHQINQWIAKDAEKNADYEKTKLFFRKSTIDSPSAILTSHQAPEFNCTNASSVTISKFDGTGASECDSDSETEEAENAEHTMCTTESQGSSFLFVHQEYWQQKLLLKYGNDLALLDATYKTTQYSLPLFFLCVRTNCGYIPAAEFIVEHETSQSIAEALTVISSWNQNWNPSNFMIDYSEPELNAISEIFPSTSVYLCEFHREQAWTRWTRNGIVY